MERSPYPRRGEVYWVKLDPTVGAEISKTRPRLVVGADGMNRSRKTVLVLPISNGAPHPFPVHVVLTSSVEGSHVITDQLRAADRGGLGEFAGTVSNQDLDEVSSALRSVLALG